MVAEGTERRGQQPTSIGITPSMSSLNRISQEVQIHPSPCLLRKQIPRLDNRHFNEIYPSDNVIRVVQKSHGVHEVKMPEVATWVLNATHWFSLLKQPMMIVIRRRDWSDASKFQYLMQILQVQFQDYVPKYHIFVDQEDNVDKLIQYWQEPTTLWDGQPVLGFMAETYLDNLPTVGFKDFNPMWSFLTTSVNQCWEPMTFGMAPWHLSEHAEKSKSKEALQSQSPIAAFKACNVIQAIGIAYSKIVLPVVTPRVNPGIGPTAPPHGTTHIHGNIQQSMQINCVEFHGQVLFYARNVLYWCESSSARRMQIIRIAPLQTQQAPSCGVQ